MADTLVTAARQLGPNAALAHADIGFGDADATERNVAALGPIIPSLVRSGGMVLCDQSLDRFEGLTAAPLPRDVEPGRYYAYRRD